MVKVHGMSASGNCHKVRMVLEALKLPYVWHEVDTRSGATRTPAFLAMNPNGKVPVAEVEPGVFLPESNAIMYYLADGTPLLPSNRLKRARVMEWLFFEQYSHEPYIAVARFLRRFHPDPDSQRALADSRMDGGYRALGVMEAQLAREPFFSAAITRSPTSDCTHTRTLHRRADSNSRASRRFARGSRGSRRSLAT